jgi:spore maturation protein SpmA
MTLNYIWLAFFVIAFIVALFRLIFFGDIEPFNAMTGNTFEMAKTGFELSLGLTGVMTLWLGVMKVGEKGGLVQILARLVTPLFSRLMPDIPKNHPVMGSIMMNLAANMLGLDNAATPLGLKAMQQLQDLNKEKERASDPMIMFLVLNTSGLTLIPVSIMVYRAQLGAAQPADVFIPILIATFFSTLVGVITVSLFQRIRLWQPVILLYSAVLTLVVSLIIYYFVQLPQDRIGVVSSGVSNVILLTIIVLFLGMAAFKKINVYDSFIEGAKEGFSVAVRIIPYLIAMLVGIGVFRASGAMDFLVDGIKSGVAFFGGDVSFADAIPTAIMKPLSGSGARGMMVETMKHFGADSFAGRLSCVFQGASDTTFYILAVYFGSVGVRQTRHAVAAGLIADLAGVVAAIVVAYLFFAI